jgi:hypothetical protein
MYTQAVGILALIMLSGPALAADPVAQILQDAKDTCASFENGEFAANGAVVEIDLTGDGKADTVVDESQFSCSSAASMYCGSGGCMLHAVINDQSWRFQAEGWHMIRWDSRPILLIARAADGAAGPGRNRAMKPSFGAAATC